MRGDRRLAGLPPPARRLYPELDRLQAMQSCMGATGSRRPRELTEGEDASVKENGRKRFFAHSTGLPDKRNWHLLSDHLREVGERAAACASVFGGAELGRVAGRLHDIGKYTRRFQSRLDGDPTRVDHATWGACIARQRYGSIGTLIAYAIAGHHAGLANGRPGWDDQSRASLLDRLSEEYRSRELPALEPEWEQEVVLPDRLSMPSGFVAHPKPQYRLFQLSLLVRMVFSCLVDADFIDTDNFYRAIEGRPPRDEGSGNKPSLLELRDALDRYLAGLPSTGGINPERARILREVRSKATMDTGLFSLTVPTGGGKTLASLAFALDHAIANGLRRVIYVIPFTSVVEQTAEVFRQALAVSSSQDDVVLEHHSAFFDDPSREPQAAEKRRLAMENWDAPIVVTTSVQFFESLFADRPSRCRKLHNIAGSVVILDEAQTLPHALLRPCVAVLDELARNYKVSPVLCTATQPALQADKGFKDGLENVEELAPGPLEGLYEKLRRVRVRHAGELDDEALAQRLRRHDQVLCIVNNRKHAHHLFESIADFPGARHLSTLMHARHRSAVLAGIRKELKSGHPCRLVSTSLVEAGVDLSFPTVLRAETGLDSIAQAAGRCNRNGERDVGSSEVLVFRPANPDWRPPRELELFAEAFRTIERTYRDDLLSLQAIEAYFREVNFRLGDDRMDRHDLLGLLGDGGVDGIPFETLAGKFRMIQSTMRPVIVPYLPGSREVAPEVGEAIRLLERAGATSAARRLQPWVVQVPEQGYVALRKVGAIEPIAGDRYGEQFMRLVNPRLYDSRYGLHWDDNPQFLESDALVA